MRSRSFSLYLSFLIIKLPIFLGYEPGRGIVTGANPFDVISLPVLPLSAFFILVSAVFVLERRNLNTYLGLNALFGSLVVLFNVTLSATALNFYGPEYIIHCQPVIVCIQLVAVIYIFNKKTHAPAR